MDGFVKAIAKTTGRTVRIPAHWVDHPVFGPRYELPDEVPALEEVPTATSRKADIEAYAAARDIDLTGARTRAQMVDLIEAHTPPDVIDDGDVDPESPDSDQEPDQTPATGDQEE
jgi:hypothetical protein